jgi:hypothetical protein
MSEYTAYDNLGTTDDVRGIIIEVPMLTLYKFYTTMPPGLPHFLGDGLFWDDKEAEGYCSTAWPDAYARGIEMRVYE